MDRPDARLHVRKAVKGNAMIDLLDDRQRLFELYRPREAEFSLVDVPELPFAVIDGEGPPEQHAGEAIKALFQAIQPIRRETRARMGKAFVEPPVEMLYRADDPADMVHDRKERWNWRAMVTLPAWIDAAALDRSIAEAREHMDAVPASLHFERFAEGLCAQIMHVGPTNDVPALLQRLYSGFLPDRGLEPVGAHHEIYLDDWNRVAPERRKLILRQPVRPVPNPQRSTS